MNLEATVKGLEEAKALLGYLKNLTGHTPSVSLSVTVARTGVDAAIEILEAVRDSEISCSVDMVVSLEAWEAEKDDG